MQNGRCAMANANSRAIQLALIIFVISSERYLATHTFSWNEIHALMESRLESTFRQVRASV